MYKLISVLLFVSAFLALTQAELPKFIKKCSRNELNLGVCVAQNGNLALAAILKDLKNQPTSTHNLDGINLKINDNLELNLDQIKCKSEGLFLTEQTYVNLAEKALIAYFQADTVIMNVEFTFKNTDRNILENGTAVLELEDLTYGWKPNMILQKRNEKLYYYTQSAKGILAVQKFEFTPSYALMEGGLVHANWDQIKSGLLEKFNNIATKIITKEVNKYLALASVDELFLP